MKKVVLSITAASGGGKTTLEKGLEEHFPHGRVTTITSRQHRKGEKANAYHFRTRSEISRMTDLLWSLDIHGNRYAVAMGDFTKALESDAALRMLVSRPNDTMCSKKNFAAQMSQWLKFTSLVQLKMSYGDDYKLVVKLRRA